MEISAWLLFQVHTLIASSLDITSQTNFLNGSGIVSTGAGVAVPFAWLGRAMGIPVVYIESVTRISSLSLSGRMIKPVASDLFVQWPELAAATPGARYEGSNLAVAA